jgi:hypothetical protein
LQLHLRQRRNILLEKRYTKRSTRSDFVTGFFRFFLCAALLVEWGVGASRLGEVERRTFELRPAVVFISVKEGPCY